MLSPSLEMQQFQRSRGLYRFTTVMDGVSSLPVGDGKAQVGCGVARANAAFSRDRLCISSALRAWMSGDIKPDSNNSFSS